MTTDHLQVRTSDRGFDYLPDIPSEYGGYVSVYESSAASGPHVWLKAIAPVNLNEPTGPAVEAPIHLTAENAWRLAEQLVTLVVNHYQNDDEASWTGDAARDALNAAYASAATDVGHASHNGACPDAGIVLPDLQRRGFTVIRSAYRPVPDETITADVDPLRFALQLVGTKCETYTGDVTCVEGGGRSPYARYGADRWCDRCIARVALAGDPFPDWGTNGVEEVPLADLPTTKEHDDQS